MCELTKPWYNSVGHKTKQNYMNVRNIFVRKSKAGAEEKQKKETCWRRAIRLLQSDTGNLKHSGTGLTFRTRWATNNGIYICGSGGVPIWHFSGRV